MVRVRALGTRLVWNSRVVLWLHPVLVLIYFYFNYYFFFFAFRPRGFRLTNSIDFFFLTDVGAFQKCNLARIPSRVVMSRPGDKLEHLKQLLLHLNEFSQANPNLLQLFNSSAYGGKDLLFQDSTVKLIDVMDKNSTEAWLGEQYFLALKTLTSCHRVVAVARSRTDKAKPSRTGQLLLIQLITIVFSLIWNA